MKQWVIIGLAILGSAMSALAVWASEQLPAWQLAATTPASTDAALPDSAQQAIDQLAQQVPVLSTQPSAVPGLYEVMLESGQIVYVPQQGQHFLVGSLYQLDGMVNLTEQALHKSQAPMAKNRQQLLSQQPPQEQIVFAAQGKTLASIAVFTDVDCPYCRKLHADIEQYTQAGIEVRYYAFPRTGLDSPTYHKMVSAWCSDNPQQALERLKRLQSIETRQCNNPVARHYQLGVQLGVRGTPSIITPSGELITGYIPFDKLKEQLQIEG